MPDSPNKSRPEPEPQTGPSPQLNYISPRDDPERASLEIIRAIIAAILSVIAVLSLVLYWLNNTNKLWVHPPSRLPPPAYLGPIIATAIVVLILSGTALRYYIRDGSTAFFKGI